MAGGLVALAVTSGRRLPQASAAALGWLGIAGIAWSLFRYSDTTSFPGAAAIVPVVAVSLVILAGATRPAHGPGWMLSQRPLVWLGEISYSLYLVHWPILEIAKAHAGTAQALPLGLRCFLMIACVPIAWFLYRVVESPLRRSPALVRRGPAPSLLGAGACSLLILISAMGVSSLAARAPQTDVRKAASVRASGLALSPAGTTYVPANLTPSLKRAGDDNPAIYSDGCHVPFEATAPNPCQFGKNPSAPRVVLFGDSHAAQWFPPLDALAERGVILLEVETKSGCPAADVTVQFQSGTSYSPYPQCDEWRNAALREISVHQPAAVVMSQMTHQPRVDGSMIPASEWRAGIERTLAALPPAAAKVVVGDTPHPGDAPNVCLSAHLEDTAACSLRRSTVLSKTMETAQRRAATSGGAAYLSLNDYLCNKATCPPIIGSTLVYRDGSHLTATMAKAFAPTFDEELRKVLGAALADG